MNKYLIIGIIAVLVIGGGIGAYFFTRKKQPTDNKREAQGAPTSGRKYPKLPRYDEKEEPKAQMWVDLGQFQQRNKMPKEKADKVLAFMKGYDVFVSAPTLDFLLPDINAWLNSDVYKPYHWQIKVGEFNNQ